MFPTQHILINAFMQTADNNLLVAYDRNKPNFDYFVLQNTIPSAIAFVQQVLTGVYTLTTQSVTIEKSLDNADGGAAAAVAAAAVEEVVKATAEEDARRDLVNNIKKILNPDADGAARAELKEGVKTVEAEAAAAKEAEAAAAKAEARERANAAMAMTDGERDAFLKKDNTLVNQQFSYYRERVEMKLRKLEAAAAEATEAAAAAAAKKAGLASRRAALAAAKKAAGAAAEAAEAEEGAAKKAAEAEEGAAEAAAEAGGASKTQVAPDIEMLFSKLRF